VSNSTRDRSGRPAAEPNPVDGSPGDTHQGNTNQGNPNQGEGNRSADRRYREATERFVRSQRGHEAVREAGKLSPEQQRDIEQAEQQAKQRAKEHDPDELRNPRKPAT
jgi:hypothetical protein